MDITTTEALARINASYTSSLLREAVVQTAAVLGLDLSAYNALQSAAASAVMVDALANRPGTGYPDAAGFMSMFEDIVRGQSALFAAVAIANTASASDDSLIDEVRNVATVLGSIANSSTQLSGQPVSALISYADALLITHDNFDHAGQYAFVSYLIALEPAAGYSSFNQLMSVVQSKAFDAYRAGQAADGAARSALAELNLATDAASLQALLTSRAATLAIELDAYQALAPELRDAVAAELWAARPAAGFDRVESLNSRFEAVVHTLTPVPVNLPPLLATPEALLLVDTAAADLYPTVQGQLVASDADSSALVYGLQGATVLGGMATLVGLHGRLTLDTRSGAYSFVPDRAAIEARNAPLSEQFTFSVSDGSALVEAALRVELSATNDGPTGTLRVAGRAQPGQVLSADAVLADAEGLGELGYQWRVDGVDIAGATASRLDLSAFAVGQSVSVRVSYIDLQGTPESVLSAALTLQQPGSASLAGKVYHWKNHALLADVALELGPLSSPDPGTDSRLVSGLSAGEGQFEFDGLDVGAHLLQASRALGSSEGSAVNSADALAALKIAVGRNPNADGAPLSPYQLIAADVNEDGKVNSADALAILKMAVKRTDAPAREWLFVSEAADFWDETAANGLGASTITRSAVTWERDGVALDMDADATLNLVAVLKGDVNGNWAPPAGSPVLPLSHFDALNAAGIGPLAQWGVLPV